jgi:stearoyl-CoA desaturase (delta-9 desaturase)
MMMHRYWSHRSFEFKSSILKWIFTGLAVLSCRGSVLGWVYIHRLHHRYSDTEKDPHAPSFKGWRIFLPYFLKYDENINKFIIKDFLNPIQLHIGKYFMLYIFLWIILLGSMNIWFLYFAWILPVALTQLAVSSFLYFGHTKNRDINTSRDSLLISILFWGEGWHINHHKNPGRWNNRIKFWEIDPTSWVIWMVKK